MKKYLSVIMLAARGSFFKVIGVMIMMAAAQIGVFYTKYQALITERQNQLNEQLLHPENGIWDIAFPAMERVLDKGIANGYITVAGIWIMAFVLIGILLNQAGAPWKSGSENIRMTLQRMPMKEWKITFCYAVYNFGIWLIFWAFSIGVVLAICEVYYKFAILDAYGSQSTFLAFYRNELFHSLLPLEDVTRYVRNIGMFVALSVMSATTGFWNRRGKRNLVSFICIGLMAGAFPGRMGNQGADLWWVVVSVAVIIMECYRMFSHMIDEE